MDTINTINLGSLYDYIKDTVDDGKYSPSTGWLACKCPYCDSASNKRHLSIQLKEGTPLIYKCFRASCGVSGVLNKKIARDLGLIDPIFLKHIQDAYNNNIAIDGNKRGIIKRLKNIDYGTLTDEVKEYFHKRTGYELTEELQSKFRIFCSISEFMEKNANVPRLSGDLLKYRLFRENSYNEKYIHFVNHTNTMLYGRQINGDSKFKHSLVNVENTLLTHMPYVFQSDGTDLYEDNENTLFIGEGIFDIINGYLHIYKNYKGVFMASTSFVSTANLINFFTKHVFRPNIVILSDSDVDMAVYKKAVLRRVNTRRTGDITIVYNKEDKDLGDYKGKPYKLDIIKVHKKRRVR